VFWPVDNLTPHPGGGDFLKLFLGDGQQEAEIDPEDRKQLILIVSAGSFPLVEVLRR
jgi:hypothetical protein